MAHDHTNKGNLVAVVSNGTAVLGLGNLGALASKPVMGGKAVLFKRFADINGVDLEVATEDVDEVCQEVRGSLAAEGLGNAVGEPTVANTPHLDARPSSTGGSGGAASTPTTCTGSRRVTAMSRGPNARAGARRRHGH